MMFYCELSWFFLWIDRYVTLLKKRPFSILVTFFAKCIPVDTRQSDHKIWSLRTCLPSVLSVTLDKVYKLCRVLWP